MKIIKRALLAFALLAVGGYVTALAQTQAEMNAEACGKYNKADAEMNKIYRQILNEYKQDKIFVQKLKAAQRAWIAFRDAHLASIYPNPDPSFYGSVNPMCRCIRLAELTTERTKVLRQWIEGIKEGDVCAGSLRWKK